AAPQGFCLSIVPVKQKNQDSDIILTAVQAVLQDLVQDRLLTTPITGASWDVVKSTNFDRDSVNVAYEMFLPLDGAAWSSDALYQALSMTIPSMCHEEGDNSSKEPAFFGWSSLQWSNFLVGNLGASVDSANASKVQAPTGKQMWWTWTSSDSSQGATEASPSSTRKLAFGIEYDVVDASRPQTANDWLPPSFLVQDPTCSSLSTRRRAFEVTNGNEIAPLDSPTFAKDDLPSPKTLEKYPYRASIEQVLRRQYTNKGKFESWIEIEPLMGKDEAMNTECRVVYRQALPEFLSPVWQSLAVDADFGATGLNSANVPSDGLVSSVEWLPNGQ
ncbi:MAG: hypothetical protein SGILL_005705, partial [Bacillariaceae sp.]